MNQSKSGRIRLIFGIAQSLSIAVAAVCLMRACVSIYRLGDHPFTRDSVAEAFGPIAVPVYLCLALVIAGFVLDALLPRDTRREKMPRNIRLILTQLQERTDLSACGEALRQDILKLRAQRRNRRRILAAVEVAAAAVFLCYGANPANFHQTQINSSMVGAMKVLIPCLLPCFALAVYAHYADKRSMEQEIALLKQAGPGPRPSRTEPAVSGKKATAVKTVLVVLGIALLIFGYCTGGTVDVLTKAINICTECVGLG